MTALALRVGWCPGALRPMRAGDGLLVRIKPRGSRLTLAQAEAVAALALRFGNGLLNLTSRGNLQLRGASEAGLPRLIDGLTSAGLLDASAEGEAVRNVQSSPLAEADPAAVLDIRPIVAAWEDRLSGDPALWRLPPKFAWSVDGGGRLGLHGVAADVRFTAVRRGGAPLFAVALESGDRIALCPPAALCDVAHAIAMAFLDLCAERRMAPHRMRDLVAACGAAAILERAGWRFEAAEVNPASVASPIGAMTDGSWSFVGAAPAFGRLEVATLTAVARFAGDAGAADLRLTPWRSLIVAGLTGGAARRLADRLAQAGLIVDPADPRLAIAACAGEPACLRATTPVQADADRLAQRLRHPSGRPVALHLSGCAKGCAQAGPAAWTIVGRAGAYDVVRNGRAADPPIDVGLSLDAVAALLREAAP